MRATLLSVISLTLLVPSRILAQSPTLDLQAGLGYARVFDAGGISFSAALDRALSAPQSSFQQALGGSLWYAHTGIASVPNDPEGRNLYGVGVRYRVAFRPSQSFRPFLAVPLELLHSSIPDRDALVSAALGRVPEPPGERPVEDMIGSEWGWGTGLEAGFRVGTGERLSAQTSVQVLYQKIYDSGTRNGAWSWHAGLSYALGGS
jgi:hypothetical protein